MNRAKYIPAAAILIAVAFIFSCSGTDGSDGADGKNGANGANGANGTSCVIKIASGTEIVKGDLKIVCGNAVVGYLSNGKNGASGAEGTPGAAGFDGVNGTSCAVEATEGAELANGDFKIICEGVVVGYLNNGIDGIPGVDGTDGIDGTDGTDGATGDQGSRGNDGADGEDGVFCSTEDAGTHVEITCGENPPVNLSKIEWCGVTPYNPAAKFCDGGLIYDLCGGKDYNPSTQFCSGDAIYSKCGGEAYSLENQFCDTRDSKIYKKVKIGTQVWMAENLNYDASGSKCYANADSNCVKYGRLYNWATAMGIDAVYNSSSYTASAKHRGICPEGWHIPSDVDWDALKAAVGGASTAGSKLKATSGWNYHATYGNGTDDYGFSALPGGYGNSGGSFNHVGNYGYWWSASEYDASSAYSRGMYFNNEDARWYIHNKLNLCSLRCSQD